MMLRAAAGGWEEERESGRCRGVRCCVNDSDVCLQICTAQRYFRPSHPLESDFPSITVRSDRSVMYCTTCVYFSGVGFFQVGLVGGRESDSVD